MYTIKINYYILVLNYYFFKIYLNYYILVLNYSHYKNHFTNSLQNNFDNKKIITYKTKKKYKN